MAVPAEKLSSSPIKSKYEQLEQLVSSGVGGVYSGATALFGCGNDLSFYKSFGELETAASERESRGNVSEDSVFDLGSLSAPVALAPLFLNLQCTGWIKPGERVSRYLNGFSTYGKSQITIADLLAHRTGFPLSISFVDIFLREVSRRPGFITSPAVKDSFLSEVKNIRISGQHERSGEYSALNMVAAGMVFESATGHSLEELLRSVLLTSASMPATSYMSEKLRRRFSKDFDTSIFVHRKYCSSRDRIVCGEPQDLTSWALGGVSGASGLFSTVGDMHRYACWFMEIVSSVGGATPTQELSSAWAESTKEGGPWKLGWESLGDVDGLSDSAIGYVSESGCALVLDPATQRHAIFLSSARGTDSFHGKPASANLRRHILDIVALGMKKI
jgi:CubicO group peptidase (beta-lactamase class C family)